MLPRICYLLLCVFRVCVDSRRKKPCAGHSSEVLLQPEGGGGDRHPEWARIPHNSRRPIGGLYGSIAVCALTIGDGCQTGRHSSMLMQRWFADLSADLLCFFYTNLDDVMRSECTVVGDIQVPHSHTFNRTNASPETTESCLRCRLYRDCRRPSASLQKHLRGADCTATVADRRRRYGDREIQSAIDRRCYKFL